MDVVTLGETMVLFSPDAQGPLRHARSFSMKFAGAESNVAVGLARLGHRVRWISQVGNDEFGDAMTAFLRGEGVDVQYVTTHTSASTGVFFKEFRRVNDTRVYYYRAQSAASRMMPETLPAAAIAGAKFLHITGITPALSESCRSVIDKAIQLAKDSGTKIVFDPNIRLKLWNHAEEARRVLIEYARNSDIVLPGIAEGQFLFGEQTAEQLADRFHELDIETVVIKLGKEGSLCSQMNGPKNIIKGFRVEHVVDPIGAGDGFAAGVISGLLDGKTVEEAAKRGNAIGAMVTMVNGDVEGLPVRGDLLSFMEGSVDDVTR